MAIATKTWTFDAGLESWAATAGNKSTGSRNTSDGSPGTGCLQFVISGKSSSNTNYWEIAGSWESLFGIPAGSTVTQVGGGASDGHLWKCSSYTNGAASSDGAFQFYDNTPTLQGAFSAAQTNFTTTTAWSSRVAAGALSVASGLQASSTVVRFRLNDTLATTTGTSGGPTILQDQVVLTITYSYAVSQTAITPWTALDALLKVSVPFYGGVVTMIGAHDTPYEYVAGGPVAVLQSNDKPFEVLKPVSRKSSD